MTFAHLKQLEKLETSIRDALVDARDRKRFSEKRWYQIVAALDCIGDGVIALRSYEEHGFGRRQGDKYLRLFGLLQCIFMQQDSIRLLAKEVGSLDLAPAKTDAWARVRELRNRIGGHPAERAGAVARRSIEDNHLRVLHWATGPRTESIKVRDWVAEYIREAAGHMATVLKMAEGATP
jgi:hypothetical protein